MLSDSIAKLRNRRSRLADEISRIDDTLSRYDEVTRAIEEMVDGVVASTPDDVTSVSATVAHVPTGRRGPSGSSPEEIVAASIKAVNTKNRPMTRYELVEAVEGQGLTVGGLDKARNMGTILWRSKAFDNDGEGYRPKGWKPFIKQDFDL